MNKVDLIKNTYLFRDIAASDLSALAGIAEEKDLTAGEIAEKFRISFPSISHHLDLLKQAKLVTSEKDGQYVYYSLNTTVVDEIMKWLLQFKSKKK